MTYCQKWRTIIVIFQKTLRFFVDLPILYLEEVYSMTKISSIAQSIQSQQVQRKGRKTEVSPGNQANDKVEISSEARKLQDSSAVQSVATKAVNDSPEVREDKIEEVRQKIVDGFYDQANIASALADKLLREFGI